MPGTKGGELAARLRERDPRTTVLFMSGYPEKELLARGIDTDVMPLLRKPFKAAELVEAVQVLLESSHRF